MRRLYIVGNEDLKERGRKEKKTGREKEDNEEREREGERGEKGRRGGGGLERSDRKMDEKNDMC